MPDDIPLDDTASQSERKPGSTPELGKPGKPEPRQIGPESEVRGGPEAPPDKAAPTKRGKPAGAA